MSFLPAALLLFAPLSFPVSPQIQLGLNFAWSPLFFNIKDLRLASMEITGQLVFLFRVCCPPGAFWGCREMPGALAQAAKDLRLASLEITAQLEVPRVLPTGCVLGR